ncbi:MAG: hypothetical protein M1835_007912, partial [Candelina submexicana]
QSFTWDPTDDMWLDVATGAHVSYDTVMKIKDLGLHFTVAGRTEARLRVGHYIHHLKRVGRATAGWGESEKAGLEDVVAVLVPTLSILANFCVAHRNCRWVTGKN